MPKGKKLSKAKKTTGKSGGNKKVQSGAIFHEVGRTDKGQGAMQEEGY